MTGSSRFSEGETIASAQLPDGGTSPLYEIAPNAISMPVVRRRGQRWWLARALAISSAGALVAVLGYSAMAQSITSSPNNIKVEGGTVSHDSGSADPLTEA